MRSRGSSPTAQHRWRAALAAACAAASVACGISAPAPARHLVLVTIDTLRADRLGAYGNRLIETPNLDRLAREGALALEATAHVPLTRPSHVSLFTGRLPPETGVRDNLAPAVVGDAPLLAAVLKRAGFVTAAFVSSIVLDKSSGLDRGFDTYSASFSSTGVEAQFLNTLQRKGDVTTAEAIAWLEQAVRRPEPKPRLFVWLHLYDPHDPYAPPEPYATRYADRLYDGEVAWSDDLVGRLEAALSRLGLRPETLVVVTSDHGEGLGEHGETLHGFFTYQTTLHVPFLVRGPGIPAGTRLSSTLRLVDVFPSLLDLLGVPPPAGAGFSGRSVAGALRGGPQPPEPVTYAESLVPLLHFGWSDLRVIREGRWKYIQAPRPELYDLSRDPGESDNRAAAEPARADALRAALGRILDDERKAGAGRSQAGPVPPELLEKLGALGYVGGVVPAETRTPGADPKDKIDDFRIANDLIREGLLRLHDRDYRASVERFQQVLERGISSFEVHFYLARGLAGLGRHREAAAHFAEAARRQPALAACWRGLAGSRAAAGDLPGALEALRAGQAALPGDAGLRIDEGQLLADAGRKPEARRVWESALPLAPRNAELRAQLGELQRDLGDVPGAIATQREAVDLAPDNASYWNALGMTLGGSGSTKDAEAAFREAVRRDEKNHRYTYNLGLILLRQGRASEARPYFEKALAADPSFAPARERLKELSSR